MYKTVSESVETALALKSLVANANHCAVVIAPVFTAIKTVADRLEGSNIQVAGQDCAPVLEHGPHTGEVAADMLRDAGATYVIIGHSERRQYYHETDLFVRRKTQAAIAAGLIAIVCVGESLTQRDQGIAESVVRGQLEGGLSGLTASDLDRIIIAYEPVWAIGTGRTATPDQAQEMHAFIRRVLRALYSPEVVQSLRILYGGSVKPSNAQELLSVKNVDGALVGGASLKAADFLSIAETYLKIG